MNPIEAGKEALEAIVLPLREEKQRLVERIDEIDVTLKPLEAAISPLGGRSRSARRAKCKTATRTVNQEDVRQVLEKLVTANPGVPQETLLATAKRTLKEQHGLDLKGFANRCREVLGREPFVVDQADCVGLIAATEPKAKPHEANTRLREPNVAGDNFATTGLKG
ncbi:MAG: hypothetical protein KDA57_20100 [Planctomycetales bacterium]|nr:hypothetical protein [Planctomycetales bacterium]